MLTLIVQVYHNLRYLSISHYEILYNIFTYYIRGEKMRLKDLREDSDITQKELAKYLHIKQNTYSQYENGQRQIPLDLLITLARYYDTSTDYILGITDIKTAYPRK